MVTETDRQAQRLVGVLGGMGPLATVDFLRKLVIATPAACDQDHIALVVRFCPEVPDRDAAVFGHGISPEPMLVRAALALRQAGAQVLAIPCNTAHFWHDAIVKASGLPILHIADAALAAVPTDLSDAIGLIATRGTLAGAIYQRRMPQAAWVVPAEEEVTRLVMPGIRAVKSGRIDEASELLGAATELLIGRGAQVVLMACTEVPVALAGHSFRVPMVDPTEALAKACVRWALQPSAPAPRQDPAAPAAEPVFRESPVFDCKRR